jgi:hypothetical protein
MLPGEHLEGLGQNFSAFLSGHLATNIKTCARASGERSATKPSYCSGAHISPSTGLRRYRPLVALPPVHQHPIQPHEKEGAGQAGHDLSDNLSPRCRTSFHAMKDCSEQVD